MWHPEAARTSPQRATKRCLVDRDLVEGYFRAFVEAMAPWQTPDEQNTFVVPTPEGKPSTGKVPCAPPTPDRAAGTTDEPNTVRDGRQDKTTHDEQSHTDAREASPPPLSPSTRPHLVILAPERTSEAKQVLVSVPQKVCNSFRATGTCRFGSRCLYHHSRDSPDERVRCARDEGMASKKGRPDLSVHERPRSEPSGSSTTTALSLSPTMPHSMRSSERDDASRGALEGDRWTALRSRAAEKQQGSPHPSHGDPSSGAVSSSNKSRSSSAGIRHPQPRAQCAAAENRRVSECDVTERQTEHLTRVALSSPQRVEMAHTTRTQAESTPTGAARVRGGAAVVHCDGDRAYCLPLPSTHDNGHGNRRRAASPDRLALPARQPTDSTPPPQGCTMTAMDTGDWRMCCWYPVFLQPMQMTFGVPQTAFPYTSVSAAQPWMAPSPSCAPWNSSWCYPPQACMPFPVAQAWSSDTWRDNAWQ